MKTMYSIWLIVLALFFIGGAAQAAAVRVGPSADVEAAVSIGEKRPETAKAERKRKKFEKQRKRLERKMEKRGLTGEAQSQEVWDDSKFRLSILLLLVAIGLGLIGAIINLGGLFSFMAGLFALGGIILLIWSLVEYYG